MCILRYFQPDIEFLVGIMAEDSRKIGGSVRINTNLGQFVFITNTNDMETNSY